MRAAACVTTEKCRQFFTADIWRPATLTLSHQKLLIMLDNERFYSTILSLKVGDETQAAILKDVQRHPFKNAIVHVDFQRVEENEKIRISIPLHFTGAAVSPGVKSQGGLVSHMRNEVEISCLPKDLPEFIEVDISGLSLNESIHLSQLKVPQDVRPGGTGEGRCGGGGDSRSACRRARADRGGGCRRTGSGRCGSGGAGCRSGRGWSSRRRCGEEGRACEERRSQEGTGEERRKEIVFWSVMYGGRRLTALVFLRLGC